MPNRSIKHLSCYYQNVRGLNTKIQPFFTSVSQTEFDIVALSETNIQDGVLSSELFSHQYNVIRSDRKLNLTGYESGGGVLLACKNNIRLEKLDLSSFDENFPVIDILGSKCLIDHVLMYIFVVYIPPSISIPLFESFCEAFSQFNCLLEENVIVLGDFNVPKFIDDNTNDSKKQTIQNFATLLNFKQYNSVTNTTGRLLDLVFANIKCEVFHDNAPFVPEDIYHPALFVSIDLNLQVNINFVSNNTNKVYNFKKADFPSLYNAILNTDWIFLEHCIDVNVAADQFYKKLYEILDSHVPIYKSYKRKYPKWYTHEIISNIRKKNKHFKNYKNTKLEHHLQEFKRLRSLIKLEINLAYDTYLTNVQASINTNSEYFWSFINSKKQQSRIPGKMTFEDVQYDNEQAIVNVFGKFFGRVYSKPEVGETDFDEKEAINNHVNLNIESISVSEITTAIKKLKNKMTSGPDLIPSFIIKDCAYVFAEPLRILLNMAMRSSEFPKCWKIGKVCPIFKNGDYTCVANYRCITILSNFAKVFEIVLYNRICPSVRQQISLSQHGFISKRSTISNLTIFTQYISDHIDKLGQVDVVYTDFSKAFDKINHRLLLNKLRTFGFSDSLILFFSSYLIEREQYVYYNGYSSATFLATSGVPQGSNLGPLLFLLFINDLCRQLDCNKLFFADDLKLFSNIRSEVDCDSLQEVINNLQDWCILNKLHLNVDKCKVLSFTNRKTSYNFNYRINDIILSRCTDTKDLGIVFDHKLSFNKHINLKISEAMKMLGFIIRNCKNFNNMQALSTLYYSFVRSKLEYGSVIWNPCYNYQKNALEKIQRRFLKFLSFKIDGTYPVRDIDYSSLLERFNYNNLELRRNCAAIVFLYKVVRGEIDCPEILAQIKFLVPRLGTRQHVTFYCNNSRTNVQLKSPITNMCVNFNKISNSCDIHVCTKKQLLETAVSIL